MKKGETTKSLVLMTAKELFSEKGYSAVTMKDFCERTGLSRGGLYRHYASTKEIFIEMLECDRENAYAELENAILKKIPATHILNSFIRRQRQEMLDGTARLSLAVYEFCTTEEIENNYIDIRFAAAVDTLSELIQYGQLQKAFKSGDSKEIARRIIIFLEGFKISSTVVHYTDAIIEEQLRGIWGWVTNDSQKDCNNIDS